MLKHTRFGILAVFLATTSAAVAQDTLAAPNWDTVIASVNGTDITAGHIIVARDTLPEQYLTLDDATLFNGILENLIQQSILSDSIKASITTRDELVMENEARSYLAGSAVDAIVSAAITEDALKELYEANYIKGEPVPEYSAAHILVETEEEAQAIVKQLNEGAVFAELAREKSTGPSGPNGGNLGWFSKGAMVPSFEEAVLALEDGTISDPVKSDFGWHVINRLESRIKDAPDFDAVRAELETELQQLSLAAAMKTLEESSDIVRPETGAFDPAFIRDETLTGE